MHLETERLIIRPWRHEEADRLLDLLSRIEVVKWLGDGAPQPMKDLAEANARIDRYTSRDVPPLGIWALERSTDGVLVGTAPKEMEELLLRSTQQVIVRRTTKSQFVD